MKKIYLSLQLLEDMAYSSMRDPIENLKYYDHFKLEDEASVFYREDEDDYSDFFSAEDTKNAYKKTEHIFKEMNALETGDDREYYLYSFFGENLRTRNIFNNYMRGNEALAKVKTFRLVLFRLAY